jgi:predicted O-methyltransferase YrrM
MAEAAAHGFTRSCLPETGALLAVLAARSRRVCELGTGAGVGTAWLASGLRSDAALITVELEPDLAASSHRLFIADSRVTVIAGDWRNALRAGPFDLIFVDVGPAKAEGRDDVVAALSQRGMAVLDDFSPEADWRAVHGADAVRDAWRADPRLIATEVTVREGEGGMVLLVARRS